MHFSSVFGPTFSLHPLKHFQFAKIRCIQNPWGCFSSCLHLRLSALDRVCLANLCQRFRCSDSRLPRFQARAPVNDLELLLPLIPRERNLDDVNRFSVNLKHTHWPLRLFYENEAAGRRGVFATKPCRIKMALARCLYGCPAESFMEKIICKAKFYLTLRRLGVAL